MKSAKNRSLSVFLPFYNEEDNAREIVSETYSYLDSLDREFELVLVNDGSTDSTPDIIEELEDYYENVRAVHHEKNKGYGRALATGFREAEKELVFYTDGDGQFNITELGKFLDEIEKYDMVIGYREDRKDGFNRQIAAEVFNRLGNFLLPIDARDIDCAFKLVKKEVVDEIELETYRTVDAELLAKAAGENCSIQQLPVEHRERKHGESEAEGFLGVRIPLVLKTVEELIRIRLMV